MIIALPLVAARRAQVGGQAVLEGVMMRGVSHWSLAVRRPDDTIGLHEFPLVSWMKRHRVLRVPVIRGVAALGESLVLGMRALSISANESLGEGEAEFTRKEMGVTLVIAIVVAIVLFFLTPLFLTGLFKSYLGEGMLFWLVEGLVRVAIFIAYLVLITRIRDLRRVFEYHGAEHKTISCYEAELPLTPENARRFSRLHPRCGTSFLLIVMIVAIFVFSPLGLLPWWALVLSRIVGVPLIAGISFEIIKFAGKHRRKRWVQTLMWPGLKLQLLTTREPDLTQLAVAIAAMESVLAHETPGESAGDFAGVEIAA